MQGLADNFDKIKIGSFSIEFYFQAIYAALIHCRLIGRRLF